MYHILLILGFISISETATVYIKKSLLLKVILFTKPSKECKSKASRPIPVMDMTLHTDPITDHMILSAMDHNVVVAELFLKTIGMKELTRKQKVWVKNKSTCSNKHNLTFNPKPDWPVAFLLKAGWMAWHWELTQNQQKDLFPQSIEKMMI